MENKQISFFTHEFEDHEIRVVGDGRFSVYDVLVAFLEPTVRKGQKGSAINPRQLLKTLSERNPEVVHFCDNFKFPGRGQRNTPVTDEEGMYQILMLCPGKRGAEFRKWAAGIIANPDKALDHAVRKYKKLGWSDRQIKARLDGKVARYKLTDTLKEHGVSKPMEYALCTEAINLNLLGQTSKQLKASRNVKQTRDGLDELELAALTFTELKSGKNIEDKEAWGFQECKEICIDVASKVKQILDI
jgi:prophage antirepressor-like protein